MDPVQKVNALKAKRDKLEQAVAEPGTSEVDKSCYAILIGGIDLQIASLNPLLPIKGPDVTSAYFYNRRAEAAFQFGITFIGGVSFAVCAQRMGYVVQPLWAGGAGSISSFLLFNSK